MNVNKQKKVDDFNGYSFDEMKHAKKMKYLVVYPGDLDLNGCYAFKSKKDLISFMKTSYKTSRGRVAAFEIKLIGIFS